MRPIPKCLVAVILARCFVTAVAVAGELGCDGPYKGLTLAPEELATVLRNHQAWLESDRKRDDERKANLCQANLQEADLHDANLQEAILHQANLHKANLVEANLQEAILIEVNLQEAFLVDANLQETRLDMANLRRAALNGVSLQKARLYQAHLQEALLAETNLQEADLSKANLQGALYEPLPGTLPAFWTLTDPHNHLETLGFQRSLAGLIELREAFKRGGMRTQERQLTYAIEHTKQLLAWDPSWSNRYEEDTRPWPEQLAGKSESLFSYVLFELPSHYGMAPGRALWSLLGFIPGFALLYRITLQHTGNRSGLWMIVPADRLTKGRGKERVIPIRPQTAKTWPGRLLDEFRLFRISLYFSLLSAFHLGWREFNVGTLIARMQPREYTLHATGWVRTVSGIQSLLSVYLLALWVLTYFGRPFE
jgi:Pentapeptide repeats (8 copies)